MGKYKRLTVIEILLIIAIIAVLVVWLFPRLLKSLDYHSSAIGMVIPHIGDAAGTGGLNQVQIQFLKPNIPLIHYSIIPLDVSK